MVRAIKKMHLKAISTFPFKPCRNTVERAIDREKPIDAAFDNDY
jgi:hypothetical protein